MATKTELVLRDRLERFLRPDFRLRSGTGKGINEEVDVCLMQAVGWLAGEEGFAGSSSGACPVLSAYGMSLNDSGLFRDHRHLLKPFAPRIVGTRNPSLENRRALIACDCSVRVLVPILLRASRRDDWATELESLEPITDLTSATAALVVVDRIKAAAMAATALSDWAWASDAVWAAARAAWDAAWDAAWEAAMAASSDTARWSVRLGRRAWVAAADAATDAAWAAAMAAGAAARDAARDAMREASLECLDAMISI